MIYVRVFAKPNHGPSDLIVNVVAPPNGRRSKETYGLFERRSAADFLRGGLDAIGNKARGLFESIIR